MDIVLGLQWGDEGKGKFIDFISRNYNIVARFNGGANAGHSIVYKNKKITLKSLPSGILLPGVQNLLGSGVVIDPVSFQKEVQSLTDFDSDLTPRKHLLISRKANLLLPTHKWRDVYMENDPAYRTIGTTQNGIGQAYADKALRQNFRAGDIFAPGFEAELLQSWDRQCAELARLGVNVPDTELDLFLDAISFLKDFAITDTELFLNEAIRTGKKVLAEGAQATLLDIDHGTYPYVTSSTTLAAGACSSLGVSPRLVGKIYGVAKAYCTRVGNGVFPTEIQGKTGGLIREKGHEFGSNTGRARRIGWLDLPALRYSVMLNGVTHLVLTKADILDDFDRIQVCTHYQCGDHISADASSLFTQQEIKPVWLELEGWKQNISNRKNPAELPPALLNFLAFLERELQIPVGYLSVGPDREQIMKRENIATHK
ncbi:adenylosuccinate synthase [Ravibacter arvi]|uniref:Adenylosuccinate synthetase n=1 Tax=Ravibacter arvi TaxID=2051041 RepID=A0ABP8M540_9BACT